MSSVPLTVAMDIESAPAPSTTPKPRRTLLISAVVLALVIVAVIATAVTLHDSASSSSPGGLAGATRTLGRLGDMPSWHLDTSRKGPIAQLTAADSTSALAASRANPADAHEFMLSFPARNQQWLDAEVEAVSDPTSPRYGQHSSFEAIMAQVGPTADDKAAVLAWLQAGGVSADVISDRGDLLHVTTTVGQVESLFSTTMHYHTNSKTGQNGTISVGSVTVPAELSINALHGVYSYPPQVTHISTHRSGGPRQPRKSDKADAQPDKHSFHSMQAGYGSNQQCTEGEEILAQPLVSPDFLATAYNFPVRDKYTTPSGTSACVTAFGAQAYYQPDLEQQQINIGFKQQFNPTVFDKTSNQYNLEYYGIGLEANLDIQALYQISPTSTNSFYSSSAGGLNSLLQTLSAIAALPAKKLPQVVSISYGFLTSDYQYFKYSGDGPATESKLQQLATMGVTVIAASGDNGANGDNQVCTTQPDTLGAGFVTPFATTTFLPGYPASSAYVLSVGETDFLASGTSFLEALEAAFEGGPTSPPECNNCPVDETFYGEQIGFVCQSVNLGEEVVSLGNQNDFSETTSGGGFSSVFLAPSWQKAYTANYLAKDCAASIGCTLPPSGYYSPRNRGFPDVAAFGGYFAITGGGEELIVEGTSVAAPIWAGIIARLNEVQLARKGTTLGLVAPLLYQMAALQPNTFNDITSGENTCPEGNSDCAEFIQTGEGSTTCAGFRGAVGWDPVTGLGSPNVGNMITYLKTL